MVTSWFGGLGPGLLATLLASVGLIYFNRPVGKFLSVESIQSLRLVEFIIVAFLITVLNDRRRKAQRRAEAAQIELKRPITLKINSWQLFLTSCERLGCRHGLDQIPEDQPKRSGSLQ